MRRFFLDIKQSFHWKRQEDNRNREKNEQLKKLVEEFYLRRDHIFKLYKMARREKH